MNSSSLIGPDERGFDFFKIGDKVLYFPNGDNPIFRSMPAVVGVVVSIWTEKIEINHVTTTLEEHVITILDRNEASVWIKVEMPVRPLILKIGLLSPDLMLANDANHPCGAGFFMMKMEKFLSAFAEEPRA